MTSRSTTWRSGVGAVLLGLLVTTACGAGAGSAASSSTINTPATIADIEAILSTRGNTLMTPHWLPSSQPDFDQTIAPGEAAFRAKEDAFFVNLREFPLLSVLYHPDLDASGAARDATTSDEGGLPHLRLTVDEDIEFGTKPYFPVSIPVAMTFVEMRGTWYLSDEGEPAAMTKYAYARPWFGRHISAVTGDGVTAIVDGTNATGALNLGVRIEVMISAEQHALGIAGGAPPLLVDATSNGTVPTTASGALLLSNGAAPWLKEDTYILKLDPRRLASLLQDGGALRSSVKDLLTARAQGNVGGSSSRGPGD